MGTYTPVIRTHFIASYGHAGLNGGCNSITMPQPLKVTRQPVSVRV
jgi:hypothetical protein